MEVSEFKRKIIPKEMKLNIDAILEEQLFNANRYYAKMASIFNFISFGIIFPLNSLTSI